jgi:transcriptional regulator with XRE-family HTH domain
MTFGQRIIEVRKQRGITQQQLGQAVGVDKRVISKYEKDQTIPSVTTAFAIAQSLDVSLDYLTGSDKALFIDDNEVIHLLKNYNSLEGEVKATVKNMLKALNIYSQVKESV